MQKRTREILALALLVVLGVAVLCAMGWYILVGHNWNVAASNIDDSIGQMEGYTVVLFEGTRDKAAIEQREAELKAAEQAEEQAAGKSGAAADSKADGQAAEGGGSPSGSADGLVKDEGGSAATAGEPAQDGLDLDIELDGVLTIDELAESYRDKGAMVYRLDMNDKELYNEPIVLSKGDMRIGAFYLGSPARPAQALVGAKLLARQKSDFNIVITDDAGLQSYSLPTIQLIINDDRMEAPGKSGYSYSSYCVDTPYEGEVEAVIISPSRVISSKTLGTSD